MLKISTAPHINSPQDTRSIMLDVIIALLPALAAALLIFGLGALIVVLTAVAGCVAFEYLTCRYVLKTAPTTGNLSAVVTGLLLAFNLPSNMPVWMTLIGCFVAVSLPRCFWRFGQNVLQSGIGRTRFLFIFLSGADDQLAETGFSELFERRRRNGGNDARYPQTY